MSPPAAGAAAPPDAQLAHAIPGRARLRIRARRGDAAYFEALEKRLPAAPGVSEIQANPATGSLLLTHGGELEPILRFAEEASLFRCRDEPRPPAGSLLDPLLQLVRRDPHLARLLRGEADPTAIAAIVLAVLGAVQLARGQILPAGATLLTEAMKLLAHTPPPQSETDAGEGE